MGVVIEGPWGREPRKLTILSSDPMRSCFGCVNATFGPGGTFCTEFSEWIDNEQTAADDCPLFIESDDDDAA